MPTAGMVSLSWAPDTVKAACVGRARLRRGRRPVRELLSVAQRSGAGERRELRSAFRPHAATSGTTSWPASPTSTFPTPPWTIPIGAASSTPKSPGAATRCTPASTATSPSTATTSSASSSNLFTQGEFADAHALLLEARTVVGSAGPVQRRDMDLPVAVGHLSVEDRGSHLREGELRRRRPPRVRPSPASRQPPTPSPTDRTGPSGIMEATDDIDFEGYWTIDDYEAHARVWPPTDTSPPESANVDRGPMGRPAVRQPAGGDEPDARRHDPPVRAGLPALLDDAAQHAPTPAPIPRTPTGSRRSAVGHGTARSSEPRSAGRASPSSTPPTPTGSSSWWAYLPKDTFGGFPSDYYSSGYNAGDGIAGLASSHYRDQGILSYEFMIGHSQSGPNSWWESSTAPSPLTPWRGSHPGAGQGSSPHAWGMAQANSVLLDSLVAQRSDGTLIVGRGIPATWLVRGSSISVSNVPTVPAGGSQLRHHGHRSVGITRPQRATTLGKVLFQLPAFVDDIASTLGRHHR